ncbi:MULTISPECIES: RibD family protein [unclassified Leptospira]|uniref:RibD family protein n=1 Tax=unclassified Leptospira TaxID=2633828 RepID=UPI0002BE6132|nr:MULTISPECIES: RibD family protein [unclassified Leptospira]EMJ99707.1 riboflavin biosynthesis protein RibD C-terminal domain protein [Leptospira sp. B5-022]MCR1793993.1 RibD family protein [Leptospira sp. id769339]
MSGRFVSVNMAMTLDGKVCRPDGKWYGLSSRNDKRRMDQIRSEADALILGKNSILNDDPVTHLRYVESEKEPRAILLVRTGTIPSDKKVFHFSKVKPLLFCTSNNESQVRSELSEFAEIVTLQGEDLAPEIILNELEKRGYTKILLEGGPRLNDSFFRSGLVDRLYLTIVPFLIGQFGLPSITGGEFAYRNFDQEIWKLVSSEQKEQEVFLIYDKQNSPEVR